MRASDTISIVSDESHLIIQGAKMLLCAKHLGTLKVVRETSWQTSSAQSIKSVRFEWPTRCAHVAPTYMSQPKLRRVLLYLLFLFLFASWVVRRAQAFIIIIIIIFVVAAVPCQFVSSFFCSSILFSPSLAFEQYCTDGDERAGTDIIPARYYL